MAKIAWRFITILLPLATLGCAFIFPQTWARWTFVILALVEAAVFYLLERVLRDPNDDMDKY
ncbi:hypothetical protein JOC36_000380 [Weissella uvarum]|uniref:hypothetical protein n=1 Tax=Weissella uvarum TaxID=1479233 RepID=UPI001961B529|nr:hypothetical protein [Weissella uvarum]MBM7616847.1 hypothetical protein [Weissella uvarum]MCM0594701.1 hypothetical protein [Weissella uvarum]